MLVVFLDIDGVLRRISAPRFKLEPHLVARFSRWVSALEQEHADVDLVISSTWRDVFTLDELQSHFPPRLRLKVRGTTSSLEKVGEHQRYREIRAWLRAHEPEARWVAVDDQADNFPPGCPELVLVDGEEGFPEETAAV